MAYFACLEVSLREISVCVFDSDRRIKARGTMPADPMAVAGWFKNRSLCPKVIVYESGQLSIWLQRGFLELGLPVVCIDARRAHKSLPGRINKSDASDAEGLAQLARTGSYTPVHIRSIEADRVRTLVAAREWMIRLRKDLEGQVRGVLKTFGICMVDVTKGGLRQNFRDQSAAAGEKDPILRTLADNFIDIHARLCQAAVDLEKALGAKAAAHSIAKRLMTIPGVGPLVSLSFIALIEDPERFTKSSDVGAFLGLTPRRFQSGDVDWSGRISKQGDTAMRSFLVDAAATLIQNVKRFSALKSWAIRLSGRKGFRKAAVATARKIAVLMLTLWKQGTEFKSKMEATA